MGSFYRSQHELVFVFRNGKASHRNNVQLGKFGRNRTNGQSGNPKGRPKLAENIYGTIKKTLEEKVTVKIAGRTRSITKMEAAFVQLTNKAVSGDIKALREVIRLREKLQEKEPYLNNGPRFIVNFLDPKTKRPVGEKT